MKRLIPIVLLAFLTGCSDRGSKKVVTVYTALDRVFSQPILDKFEKETGIKVRAKYDTESTKTVGLVNAIRSEAGNPRCDVFWNNEIVNTIRLKNEGLLQEYRPEAASGFPATFRDKDGCWTGLAARARVLLVNTDLVKPDEEPTSIYDLARPKWRSQTGIAKPLFGTTASHVACLFAALGEEKAEDFLKEIKKNRIQVQAGNKTVALNVSAGRLAFGLTDTDDAIIEVESGKPVKIVYPDSGTSELGVLFIPNSLSLIKDCPHPEAGKALIEYLLSPEVEIALASCKSAQIPVNPEVKIDTRVQKPSEIRAMKVDFNDAAANFDKAAEYIEKSFLK